jgi:hypothetical protein
MVEFYIFDVQTITPGIRTLGTESNTKNRVRQVTTTFGRYIDQNNHGTRSP